MRISVSNRLISVPKVRHAVRDFLLAHGVLAPDSLELGEILLACTEAVSNAIVHGVTKQHTLHATIRVKEPGTFEFRLNSAQQSGPSKSQQQNQAKDQLALKGRGLMLIESLMDSVGYYPSPCDPNVVELVLEKKLTPTPC